MLRQVVQDFCAENGWNWEEFPTDSLLKEYFIVTGNDVEKMFQQHLPTVGVKHLPTGGVNTPYLRWLVGPLGPPSESTTVAMKVDPHVFVHSLIKAQLTDKEEKIPQILFPLAPEPHYDEGADESPKPSKRWKAIVTEKEREQLKKGPLNESIRPSGHMRPENDPDDDEKMQDYMKTQAADWQLPLQYRPYRCTQCGNVTLQQTNHTGEIYSTCRQCGNTSQLYVESGESPVWKLFEMWDSDRGNTDAGRVWLDAVLEMGHSSPRLDVIQQLLDSDHPGTLNNAFLFARNVMGEISASKQAQRKDKIPGGLADQETDEDKFNPSQLQMGIEAEMEHTDDKDIAKEIAMDHLMEDPRYYTKLKKIEANADQINQLIKQMPVQPYNPEDLGPFYVFMDMVREQYPVVAETRGFEVMMDAVGYAQECMNSVAEGSQENVSDMDFHCQHAKGAARTIVRMINEYYGRQAYSEGSGYSDGRESATDTTSPVSAGNVSSWSDPDLHQTDEPPKRKRKKVMHPSKDKVKENIKAMRLYGQLATGLKRYAQLTEDGAKKKRRRRRKKKTDWQKFMDQVGDMLGGGPAPGERRRRKKRREDRKKYMDEYNWSPPTEPRTDLPRGQRLRRELGPDQPSQPQQSQSNAQQVAQKILNRNQQGGRVKLTPKDISAYLTDPTVHSYLRNTPAGERINSKIEQYVRQQIEQLPEGSAARGYFEDAKETMNPQMMHNFFKGVKESKGDPMQMDTYVRNEIFQEPMHAAPAEEPMAPELDDEPVEAEPVSELMEALERGELKPEESELKPEDEEDAPADADEDDAESEEPPPLETIEIGETAEEEDLPPGWGEPDIGEAPLAKSQGVKGLTEMLKSLPKEVDDLPEKEQEQIMDAAEGAVTQALQAGQQGQDIGTALSQLWDEKVAPLVERLAPEKKSELGVGSTEAPPGVSPDAPFEELSMPDEEEKSSSEGFGVASGEPGLMRRRKDPETGKMVQQFEAIKPKELVNMGDLEWNDDAQQWELLLRGNIKPTPVVTESGEPVPYLPLAGWASPSSQEHKGELGAGIVADPPGYRRKEKLEKGTQKLLEGLQPGETESTQGQPPLTEVTEPAEAPVARKVQPLETIEEVAEVDTPEEAEAITTDPGKALPTEEGDKNPAEDVKAIEQSFEGQPPAAAQPAAEKLVGDVQTRWKDSPTLVQKLVQKIKDKLQQIMKAGQPIAELGKQTLETGQEVAQMTGETLGPTWKRWTGGSKSALRVVLPQTVVQGKLMFGPEWLHRTASRTSRIPTGRYYVQELTKATVAVRLPDSLDLSNGISGDEVAELVEDGAPVWKVKVRM